MVFMCPTMSGLNCYHLIHNSKIQYFMLYYEVKVGSALVFELFSISFKMKLRKNLSIFPTDLLAHLCACCGSQCNYRSLNKRFQDLLVQLYQIHATCKCFFVNLKFLSLLKC